MSSRPRIEELRARAAALDMTSDQFRSLGHELVDRIADFQASIRTHPVTRAEPPEQVRAALAATRVLPEAGRGPRALLRDAADLLFEHSLFNGHPRFYGYITSSAAPSVSLRTCWQLLSTRMSAPGNCLPWPRKWKLR